MVNSLTDVVGRMDQVTQVVLVLDVFIVCAILITVVHNWR